MYFKNKNLLTIYFIRKFNSHAKYIVRLAYKNFLKGLQGDNPQIAPQFKTWFYIYKNNTVYEEFKNSIRENYFVDVKDIDRQNIDVEGETISNDGGNKDPDLTQVDDAKRTEKEQEIKGPATIPVTVVASNDTTNSKDIPDFQTLKKSKPQAVQDETRLNDAQLDCSKFDEVVEDRQYVEVPVAKEEAAAEVKEILRKNTETAKEADSLEIMQAEARYLGQRQVRCFCITSGNSHKFFKIFFLRKVRVHEHR